MESRLEWLEEEGKITFWEKGLLLAEFHFYVTGEEEAEVSLQYIGCPDCEKIIQEAFLMLWNEGFEETVLVEKKSTKIAELLNSTRAVEHIYSEYMMKKEPVPDATADTCSTDVSLCLKEEGEYLQCENREKTFSCKVQPYLEGGYLYEVVVDEAERRKGIATACLSALFPVLMERGMETVYLQVGSYNIPAVRLYRKLGFEVTEELCYYGFLEPEE